jgi:phosphatidylglycerophosphatase C
VSGLSPRLAVFDLDGTLTRGDTFVPYVADFLSRRPSHWLRLVPAMATVVWYFLGRMNRDRLKERLTTICLRGASRDEIAACTARLISRVMKRGLRAAAVAALERHRSAGDRLVLLSASPDLYVQTLSERLGFHECICTQIQWNGSRLVGSFATANRRGEEKARLISAMRSTAPGGITAYANSGSDLPHLVLVDRPLLVNASARTRRRAAELGIECGDWR